MELYIFQQSEEAHDCIILHLEHKKWKIIKNITNYSKISGHIGAASICYIPSSLNNKREIHIIASYNYDGYIRIIIENKLNLSISNDIKIIVQSYYSVFS